MIDRFLNCGKPDAPIKPGANATEQTDITRFMWIGGAQSQPRLNFSRGAGILFMPTEYQKEWNRLHPDRMKLYAARSNAKRKAVNAQWQKDNRVRRNASARKCRAKHKPQRAAYARLWRARNAGQLNKRRRDRYAKDPSKQRSRAVARYAKYVNNLGVEEFIRVLKAKKSVRCYYCGKRTCKFQIDHIVPLSKGGAHSTENLAAACKPCNLSKSATPVNEWRGINQLVLI